MTVGLAGVTLCRTPKTPEMSPDPGREHPRRSNAWQDLWACPWSRWEKPFSRHLAAGGWALGLRLPAILYPFQEGLMLGSARAGPLGTCLRGSTNQEQQTRGLADCGTLDKFCSSGSLYSGTAGLDPGVPISSCSWTSPLPALPGCWPSQHTFSADTGHPGKAAPSFSGETVGPFGHGQKLASDPVTPRPRST